MLHKYKMILMLGVVLTLTVLANPVLIAAAAGTALRVSGDENFIKAAKGFATSWLIDRDTDAAMNFISPKAFSCVNLDLSEGETARTTRKDMEALLRLGLERAEEEIGTPESLEEAIQAVEPTNAGIALVTHPDEARFSLMSLPNYLAAGYGCDYRAQGGEWKVTSYIVLTP